jgi:GAF domain-containing protein
MVATDAGDMVRVLYASIAPTFRLDVCFSYACQASGLGLVASAGLTPEQEALAARLEFGQTICGRVAASREAVHVTGIQGSGDPQAAFLKALGLDTYASTPLLVGGELLGTLSFGRRAGPFSDGELEVLRTLIPPWRCPCNS